MFLINYLMNLRFQKFNETAQHEYSARDGARHVLLWHNIPLKINFSCMNMMITYCSEVYINLESLSNCNFLNMQDFFFYLFIILAKKI